MFAPKSGAEKKTSMQASLDAIDQHLNGAGASFTNLLDFRQKPSDTEPKKLYKAFAASSLIPAIAARSAGACVQFAFRSGIGFLRHVLAYVQPGSNDREEVDTKFPYIIATRAESARYVRYHPEWPPPLGTHFELRLANPKLGNSFFDPLPEGS